MTCVCDEIDPDDRPCLACPCPTCDGTGTVEVGQHRGSALSGGGGTPREAPCPTCAVAERERWEREVR